jgi:hypothetical protein
MKNVLLEKMERDVALKEQMERKLIKLQTEKRPIGGEETVINY